MTQEQAAIQYCEIKFKQQQDQIDALLNLVKEQDKKIIELAFRAVYAEKSAEVVKELS